MWGDNVVAALRALGWLAAVLPVARRVLQRRGSVEERAAAALRRARRMASRSVAMSAAWPVAASCSRTTAPAICQSPRTVRSRSPLGPGNGDGLQRRCPLSTYIAFANLHRSPRQRQHRERERRRHRGDVRDRSVLDPRHCLRAHGLGPGVAEQRRQRSAGLRQWPVLVRQPPDRRRDLR